MEKVKRFKLSDTDFWVGNLHYTLHEGEVILCAGGIETEDSRAKIMKYLKSKKLI
jgi:hypothetical protein